MLCDWSNARWIVCGSERRFRGADAPSVPAAPEGNSGYDFPLIIDALSIRQLRSFRIRNGAA
jgi:hypothetical protein